MRAIICAFTIVAATTLSAKADDLTITSRMTQANGQTTTAVSYMSKDHIRTAHGDGKESIVDANTGQMTTLDTRKKTYFVMTREDWDKFAAKMQEQMNNPEMKKMQAQFKSEKTDEAAEAMFAVNVRKTGATRRIAGYSCDVWKMSLGQMSTTEQCLSTDLHVPAELFETYRKFSEGLMNMRSMMGPMAKSTEKMQEQMKKMKGYPLATTTTIEVMGHKTIVASEVTEVKHGAIPVSTFAIPAGYTRVDNPMMKAFERHGGESRTGH